jgi:hypothetical protein
MTKPAGQDLFLIRINLIKTDSAAFQLCAMGKTLDETPPLAYPSLDMAARGG